MSRKTVEVSKVLAEANAMLANDKLSDGERQGIIALLERILFDTGNYQGYNFLDWMNGGSEQWHKQGESDDTTAYLGNQTKRFYYGG